MTVRQRLVTSEDGRALLIKSAPPGPDADRLQHEGALLELAAHPGVVSVVADRAIDEVDGGGRELHLLIAGSRTAADLEPDLVGIAGLIASLATTVADLHDLGVVHGRITVDHVVIDRDGRPVLCGLAGAAPTGAVPWGGTTPLRPADDVAALGRLLARLVDRCLEDGAAARTWGWRPAAVRAAGALGAVVEASTDPDVSAAALADAVLAAVPAARLPGPAAVAEPSVPWHTSVLRWLGLDHFDAEAVPPAAAPGMVAADGPGSTGVRSTPDAGRAVPTAVRATAASGAVGPRQTAEGPLRSVAAPPGAGARSPADGPGPSSEPAASAVPGLRSVAAMPDAGLGSAAGGPGPSSVSAERSGRAVAAMPGAGLGSAAADGPAPSSGPAASSGRGQRAVGSAPPDAEPGASADRRRPLTLVTAPPDEITARPDVMALRRRHPTVAPVPAPPDGPDRRRLPLLPALAVVGLGLLAFGVGGLLRPSGPAPPPAPAASDPDRVAVPPTSSGSATTAASPTIPTAQTIPSVEVDGARYAVGNPGDVVAIGDWDCDGTATAAVVRPATGEVFVFHDWATADHAATATLAAEVPGATAAQGIDDDGDGCPTLVVTDAAGTDTEVAT